MTNIAFRVVLQKDHTYQVEFVRPDGSPGMVTGFQSEHEARAWSIQAERMMLAADRQPTIARREGPIVLKGTSLNNFVGWKG